MQIGRLKYGRQYKQSGETLQSDESVSNYHRDSPRLIDQNEPARKLHPCSCVKHRQPPNFQVNDDTNTR